MNHSLPRISIITPTLNQGMYLEHTIQSVVSQNYPDLEYIVIDGGSTDNTLDILRKYEKNLIWISESDRGQSHAINKGLQMATGEVLAFINSDDLYQPGALLKVGRCYSKNPEVDWLTGKCRIIDHQGVEIRQAITFYKNFWLWVGSYRVLLVLDFISQPATFWSKAVFEKVGYFDESLYFTLDYDFSLRVGRHFKICVINEILASFRIHPLSKTTYSTNHQFASDFDVAARYTNSLLLRGLHAAHNAFIVAIYNFLLIWESRTSINRQPH